MSQPRPPLTNRHIAIALLSLVAFMVALSFMAVPLYGLFCKMTGYGGTPQIGATTLPTKIFDRTITVSFITDTDAALPWRFHAEQRKIDVKVGQTALVSFSAQNDTAKLTAGAAVYNVTPDKVGKYFHKTQCFCFQEQILNPSATAHFPVMFYIDPAIMNDKSVRDVTDITLAYTFYPANSAALDKAIENFGNATSLPGR